MKKWPTKKQAKRIKEQERLNDYASHLVRISTRAGNYSFMATAAQRAEAFLRTIGKWREDEHPIADPPKVCDTPKQEEPK